MSTPIRISFCNSAWEQVTLISSGWVECRRLPECAWIQVPKVQDKCFLFYYYYSIFNAKGHWGNDFPMVRTACLVFLKECYPGDRYQENFSDFFLQNEVPPPLENDNALPNQEIFLLLWYKIYITKFVIWSILRVQFSSANHIHNII